MFNLRVSQREFEISLHTSCRVRQGTQAAVKKALKAGLAGISSTQMNHVLGKHRHLHLSVSLVSRTKIQELNAQFRGKNKPTDVLSFSQVEAAIPNAPQVELGDLILCPALANEQCKTWGATPAQEIMRLTVHGLLHLFGYDHETNEADAKKMFRLQEKILEPIL